MQHTAKSDGRTTDATGSVALAGRIQAGLRADILTGVLKPGSKIRIEALSERYETSHIPIREALSGLATEGLVRREDRRGFFVAAFAPEELEDLVRTRCWLEERALTESIANRTDEWEGQLVLALHWLVRTPRATADEPPRHNEAWEQRHKHFHHVLISGCGSSVMLRFCQELRDRMDSYRIITETGDPRTFDARLDQHRAITEAALAGDTERAVAELLRHYRETSQQVAARLAEMSSKG